MSMTFSVSHEKIEMRDGKALLIYRPVASAETFEVNMSNVNACEVLRTLGLEAGYCGTVDPRVLASACEFALAGLASAPELDGEYPAMVTNTPNGGTIIDCGRSGGYLKMRITGLLKLANIAIKCDAVVTWA